MSRNIDEVSEELKMALEGGAGPKITRFALACLSGIPMVGGVFGASGSAWSEYEQHKFNKIFGAWLKLQEDEMREIGITLTEVMLRVDQNNDDVMRRIESPGYLSLIKKCFRDWSAAESEEKRLLIRNLLSNATSELQICGDDILRLFIEWIGRYSETHFSVIKQIYKRPSITRQEMWNNIHGQRVRENSPEADLFKLIIHDLTLGMIIRQHRETDYLGNFIKQKPTRPKNSSTLMKSAFDDDKEYELTGLGNWFVHYTMNEIVPKLEEKSRVTPDDDATI